jgi:hypothetical protein
MKTFFKLLLLCVLITIIALGFLGYLHFSSPKTAEMKEFFSLHQTAFEQKNGEILAALSQRTAIHSGPDEKVGYRWLEIEPQPEIYRDGDPLIVRYYTHMRGIGVGAFGTGIAYLDPSILEKVYPNLEAMGNDAKEVEGFIGYSPVSGNWHIFYWEAD